MLAKRTVPEPSWRKCSTAEYSSCMTMYRYTHKWLPTKLFFTWPYYANLKPTKHTFEHSTRLWSGRSIILMHECVKGFPNTGWVEYSGWVEDCNKGGTLALQQDRPDPPFWHLERTCSKSMEEHRIQTYLDHSTRYHLATKVTQLTLKSLDISEWRFAVASAPAAVATVVHSLGHGVVFWDILCIIVVIWALHWNIVLSSLRWMYSVQGREECTSWWSAGCNGTANPS